MRPVVAVTAVLFAAACSSGIVEQVGNPDATSTPSVDAGEGDLGNEAGRPSEAGTADGPATVGDSEVIVTDGDAGAVITDADSGVVVTPADSGVVGGDDSGAVIHPDGAQLQDSSGVGNVRDTGGAESSAGSTFDGTTGQLCASTADCKSVNGPGINRCSVSGYFAGGPIDPSPVCLSPDPCDLGDGSTIQFCDSASPSDPNSPGVCLPTQQGATGLSGQCFPKCVIPSDGTPPARVSGQERVQLLRVEPRQQQPAARHWILRGRVHRGRRLPDGQQVPEGRRHLPDDAQDADQAAGADVQRE